ncbi:MAG: Cdc6/Cdc18 family protein [Candidatus Odinarchaeota archaeon]
MNKVLRNSSAESSNNKQLKLIEEILEMESVFKDETKFSIDYIPDYLLHRDEIIKSLALLMKESTSPNFGKFHQNVIIVGPIGSGKTAIAKRFGEFLEEIKKKQGVSESTSPVIFRHVNVRKFKTPFVILTSVVKSLIPHFPRRGYSTPELLDILFETLEKRKSHLILCLDEISNLKGEKKEISDFLYSLSKQGSDRENESQVLSLILISSDRQFLKSLDESTKSCLFKNEIVLPSLTVSQLVDIYRERVEEGFMEGVIDTSIIERVATIVSENNGNVRQGIEIFWKAGKHADFFRRNGVTWDDFRAAIEETSSIRIDKDTLSELSFRQKFLLFTISGISIENQVFRIPLKEIQELYKEECIRNELKTVGNTQFWKYITALKKIGVIKVETENQGLHGRQTFVELLVSSAITIREDLEVQLFHKTRGVCNGLAKQIEK